MICYRGNTCKSLRRWEETGSGKNVGGLLLKIRDASSTEVGEKSERNDE